MEQVFAEGYIRAEVTLYLQKEDSIKRSDS